MTTVGLVSFRLGVPDGVSVVAAQKRLFELWQNLPLAESIDASVEEFAQVFAAPETAAQVSE
jgi:hypothetical protein